MLPTNIIHCPVTHTGALGSDTRHFLVILDRPLDFPEPWLSSSVKWSPSTSKLRLTQGLADTERLWGYKSLYSRPQPTRAPRTVVGGTEGRAPPVPPPLAFISLQG